MTNSNRGILKLLSPSFLILGFILILLGGYQYLNLTEQSNIDGLTILLITSGLIFLTSGVILLAVSAFNLKVSGSDRPRCGTAVNGSQSPTGPPPSAGAIENTTAAPYYDYKPGLICSTTGDPATEIPPGTRVCFFVDSNNQITNIWYS